MSEGRGLEGHPSPLQVIAPNFAGAIVQEVFTELAEAIGLVISRMGEAGIGGGIGAPSPPSLRAATPSRPQCI